MAYKALCQVHDVSLDGTDITFVCSIQITSGLKHNSLSFGPVASSTLSAALIAAMVAWAKEYARDTMGETFGLLDTVRLVNLDLIP